MSPNSTSLLQVGEELSILKIPGDVTASCLSYNVLTILNTMLRTATMSCCDMFLPPETAFITMTCLGNLNCVQFIDRNADVSPLKRKYTAEICRCAGMQKNLLDIKRELDEDKVLVSAASSVIVPMKHANMIKYENLIAQWKADIIKIKQNEKELLQNILELKEKKYVLETIGPLLGEAEAGLRSVNLRHKATGDDIDKLFVVSGVVKRVKAYPFELMLWRITLGNIYYKQADRDKSLVDPASKQKINEVAFLLAGQGEQIAKRVKIVMNAFKVNLYDCPKSMSARSDLLLNLKDRLYDTEQVLEQSLYQRCMILKNVAKKWSNWHKKVLVTKAIYHNMNLFTLDITKNCLIGKCWVQDTDLKKVQDTLETCCETADTVVPSFIHRIETKNKPPTHHCTNKFTIAFQKIIDVYSEAKYGEINPALFTIITFPFLFAVMFGDMGHAMILIIFASWMIKNESKYLNKRGSDIWNIFFTGRYLILLLGLFSLYTGFIYQEVFCKSLKMQNSMWRNTMAVPELQNVAYVQLDVINKQSKPYWYGEDPIYPLSSNVILIRNSFKMKMSIILGVIHMLFGMILSILNHIHFKKYYAIFLVFIPAFIFILCTFVWLVFLIYYKWFNYYEGHSNPKYGSACAPQILLLFIDMILMSSSTIKHNEGCDVYLFNHQKEIQFYLIIIAVLCIPVLLFGKPLYLHFRTKTELKQTKSGIHKYKQDISCADGAEPSSKTFQSIFIVQSIETIEFVLSSISHTASYLRLWALSLAHSELSDILWTMILSNIGLRDHSIWGVPKIACTFAVWASLTVAVLIVMEGLSAFLHTLRLHWVEFMSKFFIGGGYKFQPFSFKELFSDEDVNEKAACHSMNSELREIRVVKDHRV